MPLAALQRRRAADGPEAREQDGEALDLDGDGVVLELAPFEIVTLRYMPAT